MLRAICQSVQFANCAVRFWLGLRFGLVRVRAIIRVEVRVIVRFKSKNCKMRMHDFEMAQRILKIVQIGKSSETTTRVSTLNNAL